MLLTGELFGPGHLGFDSGLLAEERATHSIPGCQEQPSQEDAGQPSKLFGSGTALSERKPLISIV